MGNLYLLAASTSSKSSPLTLLLPFILIIGVFYFLLMRPQRNRQRRIQQTQSAVTPGQRVRTTAGMYGTVVAIEDEDLILEIAPDVEVRVLRRAVMDVLPGNVYTDDAEEGSEDDDEFADADDAEHVDASADGSGEPAHAEFGDAEFADEAEGSHADGAAATAKADGAEDGAEDGAATVGRAKPGRSGRSGSSADPGT
jgi:preprotein translocase subunit YajC